MDAPPPRYIGTRHEFSDELHIKWEVLLDVIRFPVARETACHTEGPLPGHRQAGKRLISLHKYNWHVCFYCRFADLLPPPLCFTIRINQVPWADLRYLFGEIMYGGHIVNDFDR